MKIKEIHATELVTMLEDPINYYYDETIELPEDEFDNPWLRRGTIVHATVRLFYKKITTRRTPKEIDEVFRYFEKTILTCLEICWDEDHGKKYLGWEDEIVESRFKNESMAMMRLFAYRETNQWFLRLEESKGNRSKAMSMLKPKFDEEKMGIRVDGIWVTGTVDAVYSDFSDSNWGYFTAEDVPSTAKLVDYKTSKVYGVFIPEGYEFQAKIYALLLYMVKGIVLDYVGIYYFRRGDVYWYRITSDDYIKTMETIKKLLKDIKEDKFFPKRSNRCSWCFWDPICDGRISK